MFAILASTNRFKETTEIMLFFYEAMMRLGMNLLKKGADGVLDQTSTAQFVNTINDAFKSFGLVILGIVVGAEWLNELIHKGENYTWYDSLGNVVKLIFGKIILDYSAIFLKGLDYEGMRMINSITGKTSSSEITFETVMTKLQDIMLEGYSSKMSLHNLGDIIENVGFYMATLIPMGLILICAGIVIIIAYARALELLIMTAMSPIAFSTFMSKETNYIGKNFLVNYFSIVMQGVVISIGFNLYSLLLNKYISDADSLFSEFGDAFTTTPTNYGKDLFVICFCTVIFAMFITKSKQIASQALGK